MFFRWNGARIRLIFFISFKIRVSFLSKDFLRRSNLSSLPSPWGGEGLTIGGFGAVTGGLGFGVTGLMPISGGFGVETGGVGFVTGGFGCVVGGFGVTPTGGCTGTG